VSLSCRDSRLAAVLPGPFEGVFEQRQLALVAANVPDDAIDQAVFEIEADLPGGLLNAIPQLRLGQRAKADLLILRDAGQPVVLEELVVEVGADRDTRVSGLSSVASRSRSMKRATSACFWTRRFSSPARRACVYSSSH
jgi:hypothetical protein